MARISTYINDLNINPDDKWIGTDADFLDATKNFTAGSVAAWIARLNYIDSPFPRYTYKDMTLPANTPRECGTITQDPAVGGVISFATLTDFMLSESQKNRCTVNISGYYVAPLQGASVIITKCTDISQWAIYTWNTATQDPVETQFWDINLTHVASNGGFENDEDYFISLLDYGGSGGGDKNHVALLTPAASVFTVNHGLNKFSSCTIVDVNDDIVEAEVEYKTNNTVEITFSQTVNNFRAFFN